MTLSDFAAQRKIQNGDIKEFEMLFKKYYEPLCHFAATFVGNLDIAEEIVEDFFCNYWKNRQSTSIQLSLKAYLYKSIKNNSLKYLQQQSVRQRYATHVKSSTAEEDTATPQQQVELSEMNQMIDQTLGQLTPRCAQIFEMSRFDGKKYQEIAEALSISIKTVEAEMGKALQLFRKNFKMHEQAPTYATNPKR